MYGEQICAEVESYAKNFGRKIEDLTDEEIGFVMEKVSDVLNEELIKVMMLGQQVPRFTRFPVRSAPMKISAE